MKAITMVKKGVGTVTLIQTDSEVFISAKEIRHPDKDILNATYRQFLADGYTVKPEKEPKKEAPKPETEKTEKVKKTREEALTEKYGDKEHRTQYIEAKKSLRKYYGAKYHIWGKVLEEKVKNALDKWEEAGRPALSC